MADPAGTGPVAPDDPLARRPLGGTGIRVPPIAVGLAPIGDMPDAFGYGVPEEQALATLRAALASPIPYLDTAALYGDGESERRVGIVLRELGGLPPGAVLQTKQGRDPATNDFSGETIKRRFARSLDLLGVDRIELVFLHDPEHTTFEAAMAQGGPVDVLRGLKDQGAIGHLGVAGGPIPVELRYLETGLFDVVITHNRWTLLNRSTEPLLAAAAARGVPVLNAAPYGSGLLAKGPDSYPRYAYQPAPAEMLERVKRIDALCAARDVPLAAAALQFSTRDPRIASTIVGMSHPERLGQTLALLAHPIPDALWPELDAVGFDAADPEANRWASR